MYRPANGSQPAFCYWTVADGEYGEMFAATVRSARRVGVEEPIHVFTDRQIPGATCHSCGKYEHKNYLFKFDFLKRATVELPYKYFVFLDADTYFVRHPGDVLSSLCGAPLHVALESDCARPSNLRPDWWGCPLDRYVQLMRAHGVRSRAVYNTNAGLWIVQRDVVDRMVQLALEFWAGCQRQGWNFTEEAPLAYVGHMLMGNPYAHVLETHSQLWASDWTGVFRDRLPDGQPWEFEDYMDGRRFVVDPAIVHCMRSKQALVAATRRSAPPMV